MADATQKTESAVDIAALRLPFSTFASPEAAATFAAEVAASAPAPHHDIVALRAHYGAFNDRLLADMLTVFDVDVREDVVGGVPVHRVRPRSGPVQAGRVLINLHGGGFMWGAGSGALVEAVPVAATAGIEVVTVDYRMAPEHRFPAASEDVTAVFAALCETCAPSAIGLYGCSAGALLTCQTQAWLTTRGLPGPGALAVLCAGGLDGPGDSGWLAAAMSGEARGQAPTPISLAGIPYLAGSAGDPTAFVGEHPELMAAFPPTLLITASRDFAASGVSAFHRRLVGAGVDARFFCFDGLWHAFQIFCRLPESREVYGLLAAHFDRNLSR